MSGSAVLNAVDDRQRGDAAGFADGHQGRRAGRCALTELVCTGIAIAHVGDIAQENGRVADGFDRKIIDRVDRIRCCCSSGPRNRWSPIFTSPEGAMRF